MSEAIPFFSDLPVKAIPAVQRLFDEAQAPGYSLPAVYSNLVSRLNAASVTPPARAIVKRWLAGAQNGLIERPVMPDGSGGADIPAAPVPNYFEHLPDAALPALVEVWAIVQAAAGTAGEEEEDERAFDGFFDAMRAINHMEPQWRGFVAYVKAIRAGQVEHPAKPTPELPAAPVAPEVAPDEPQVRAADPAPAVKPTRRVRKVKVDALVVDPASGAAVQPEVAIEADPETGHVASVLLVADEDASASLPEPAYVPLTPTNFREFAQGGVIVPETARISFTPAADPAPVSAEVATRLRSLRSQLVADTCAILEADIRRQAEKIVIDQLRAMADELEGGAV